MRYEHTDPRIEAINALTCNGGEPFPWNAYFKKGVRIKRHAEAVARKAERKQARNLKRNTPFLFADTQAEYEAQEMTCIAIASEELDGAANTAENLWFVRELEDAADSYAAGMWADIYEPEYM